MMTKIGSRCGEPYAWLERRRHGNYVDRVEVHERTENGARRRRRCYLGPEEEARASSGLEAEEVLSEGEEEPRAAGREIPDEEGEEIEPAAPTAVEGPRSYEDEFREFVRWARSRGLALCDVKRRLGMRSPGCEEEGKGGEAAPRRERMISWRRRSARSG
jgi:hypothetical protein